MDAASQVCRDGLDPIMVVCAILAVRRAPCAVRRAPCSDCYHQSLFENQPCATELFTAIQRPDLCDDFRRVGECVPPEAADLPSLSLE